MDRSLRILTGLAAAAFLCVPVAARPANHWFSIFQRKQHGKATVQTGSATPFPMGREAPPAATDVEFRPPDQMSEADREIEANSESAIAEHAGFDDLQLNEGNWTYQQIVCRALPHHLFLRFTRNNGAGDRSVFSVSIPRNGNGRLRVIPILRRGFSLYSPAPSNDNTVAAFNQIRREDGAEPNAGWLETALCYAALAGANPGTGPLTGDAVLNDPSPPVAEMIVLLGGGAMITFTDENARPRPVLWRLTFSADGTLLKARREPAVLNSHWVIPAGQKTRSSEIPATISEPGAGEPLPAANSAPPAKPLSR
jgi:hypothetical protein